MKNSLKIILVTETLVIGGAETFVLRLASFLRRRGEHVVLYVLRADKINAVLVSSIAPDIAIEPGRIPYLKLISKLDGLLFRLGCNFSLLRYLQIRRLRAYLSAEQPDIVHSHLLTSDIVTAEATQSLSIPWMTTMHGDYLAFEKQGRNRAARIQNFRHALSDVEKSVGHLVCITDIQMEQLSKLLPRLASRKQISKIYNGYAASSAATTGNLPETLPYIPPDAFVIGMVARGIRDKGWEVLISAFLELQLLDGWLVLVGDGDYLQEIRATLHDNSRIIFIGNVADPLRYIARFDVGCLPSRIKTESLPTVVIEYLYAGKPVIASNVGELPIMLNAGSDAPAGLLIEIDSVQAMAKQMQSALQQLHDNKTQREFLRANTVRALQKFEMGRCVDAYMAVYQAMQP